MDDERVTTTGRAPDGWAALREELLDTPELRAEYARTRQSVLRTRRLLQ